MHDIGVTMRSCITILLDMVDSAAFLGHVHPKKQKAAQCNRRFRIGNQEMNMLTWQSTSMDFCRVWVLYISRCNLKTQNVVDWLWIQGESKLDNLSISPSSFVPFVCYTTPWHDPSIQCNVFLANGISGFRTWGNVQQTLTFPDAVMCSWLKARLRIIGKKDWYHRL